MITRRSRRSYPQERLLQFALNNSKGIDATQPPTNNSTVESAVNLVPNLDGSFSIRKPIVRTSHEVSSTGSYRKMYLFDNEHYVVWSPGTAYTFTLFSPDGTPLQYDLIFHDRDGVRHTSTNISNFSKNWIYDSTKVEIVNTSSTSIVCNLQFNMGSQIHVEGTPYSLFDGSLYDDSYHPCRYLKIFLNETRWTVEIVNPEMNVLSTADDGSLAFDANLNLDNPFALRDAYSPYPSVKGILPYVYSSREQFETSPITLRKDNTGTSSIVFKRAILSSSIALKDTATWTTTEDDTVTYTPEFKVTILTNADSYTLKLTGGAELKLSNMSGSVGAVWNVEVRVNGDVVRNEVCYSKGPYPYRKTFSITELSMTVSNNAPSLTISTTVAWVARAPLYGLNHIHQYATTVRNLTESVKNERARIVTTVSKEADDAGVVLKAFGTVPNVEGTYAAWFKSYLGGPWEACPHIYDPNALPITVRELDESVKDEDSDAVYTTNVYYPYIGESSADSLQSAGRVDVYRIPAQDTDRAYTYMFKIISVSKIDSNHAAYLTTNRGAQYVIQAELGRALYTPVVGLSTEYASWDNGNPSSGKHLYYSKKLFSYGNPEFENIVYATEPGSFITPLTYVADTNVGGSSVITALTPWRSYLLAATETSLSIILPQEIGWTSKILTTSVGIPEEDSRCCLPGLNGIVFKSADKIYMAYPNAYSGDDTHVYITDMSKPIDHILSEYFGDGTQFAFATNSEYVLMLPDAENNETRCLRYSYDLKTWAYCKYPVVVKDYKIFSLTNIVLFCAFDGDTVEMRFDADSNTQAWGDVMEPGDVRPIYFELDTGMKTDSINFQKQFTESKFIVATEDDAEVGFADITVAIDGDPHVTRIDANSDAMFWKDSFEVKGVLGTSVRMDNNDTFGRSSSGILRQLIIRYSGKGRSVRHILRGTSNSNFKLYETYVRYKTLNVKK